MSTIADPFTGRYPEKFLRNLAMFNYGAPQRWSKMTMNETTPTPRSPRLPPLWRAEAMSEHTDAARLEATRDAIRTGTAPRPRVEGEAWAPRMPSSVVQDEINYCTHKLDRTFRDEVDLRAYLYICQDWRDFQSRLARLTAEVERLRGIAQKAIAMLNEWDESMASYQQGTSDGTTAKELAARLAALALPTPAPEAKE